MIDDKFKKNIGAILEGQQTPLSQSYEEAKVLRDEAIESAAVYPEQISQLHSVCKERGVDLERTPSIEREPELENDLEAEQELDFSK